MQDSPFNFQQCLNFESSDKIVSLPIEFSYLPVDILSKQFTKLNNPHQYRIHYLGPRVPNTLGLHKKFSQSQHSPYLSPVNSEQPIQKYEINVKKITQSYFINEKLRNNHFYKSGVYYRAFEGMNPTLNLQQQYLFNSAFQSGNLDCVIKTKPLQFDLFLKIDSNTRGHIQWFYFSVQNGKNKNKIKLNICNISKAKTLYDNGMNPFVCSLKNNKKTEWKQGNKNLTNVIFTQKDLHYDVLQNKCKNIHPYCLSFDYQFDEEDDQVLFAYCIPYTFSQMLHDINKLPTQLVKKHTLSRSLTGIDIPVLHITDHKKKRNKKNILITGRIHPAQSNSSYVLKGFMQFLCSDHKYAVQVRKKVNFFIIPMINPDGVILGNSRTSAAGRDMNRMFIDTDKQLFPQIAHLKSFVSRFLKKDEILVYYDFHGHSRKKNTFVYGPSYPLSNANYYKCRILPKLIEKKINAFRYYSCLFSISEEKKTTGRASMFQNFQIPYTYTVESSIGSYYDCQKMKIFQYDKGSWMEMGMKICQGTCSFIFGYEQYQILLKERRALRQKKKLNKLGKKTLNASSKLYLQDQVVQNNDVVLKIAYKGQGDSFLQLIQQIKTFGQDKQPLGIVKGVDEEASSDDHDEKQNFEESKLKQFNNLIIQNAHKDNLIKKLTKAQNSIGQANQKKPNKNFTRSKDAKDVQEFHLIQEICNKPSSSMSNRRTYLLTDRSSTSNHKKRIQVQVPPKKDKNQLEKNAEKIVRSRNEKKLQFDFTAPMAKRKNNMSLREAVKQTNKKEYFEKMMEKRLSEISSQKVSHFSELMFPQSTQEQKKVLLKNSNNGMFRNTLNKQVKKTERSQKFEFSNRFSELSIQRKLEPEINLIKQKVPTEFKFDEILSNMQLKSKMLKSSVKYKEKKNKSKNQNAFVFPSSFYGVQQQELKKRPNSFECSVPYQYSTAQEQSNTAFTIKKFK